jgi:ABC-type oligopeptide transport system substrate-binding subunit
VEEARRITDQEERLTMYQQADRILVKEAAIVPLLYQRSHLLVKPWVSKYPTSAIESWFWKDVIIEPH